MKSIVLTIYAVLLSGYTIFTGVRGMLGHLPEHDIVRVCTFMLIGTVGLLCMWKFVPDDRRGA